MKMIANCGGMSYRGTNTLPQMQLALVSLSCSTSVCVDKGLQILLINRVERRRCTLQMLNESKQRLVHAVQDLLHVCLGCHQIIRWCLL